MMETSRVGLIAVVVGIVLAGTPEGVAAYGGPGSALSAIGAFLAVLAALVAALFGFVWFPVKKLVRWLRGRSSAVDVGYEAEAREDAVQQ